MSKLGKRRIDYLFSLTNSEEMLINYVLLLNGLYMIAATNLILASKIDHECKPGFLLVKTL